MMKNEYMDLKMEMVCERLLMNIAIFKSDE